MNVNQMLMVLASHVLWEVYGMLIVQVDEPWIYWAGFWLGLLTYLFYVMEFAKKK